MCGICDVQNIDTINLFSDDEILRFLDDVFNGLISTSSLSTEQYLIIARKLFEGVASGYGKDIATVSFGTPDYAMLRSMRENVYRFSGAKQYQSIRQMNSLLIQDGKLITKSNFMKQARELFKEYNVNHLSTEYNTAIQQARSASLWQDIQQNKEYLPMLTYHTVGDGRVRPEHASLDEITRPVDDKFWYTCFPPNGWNCRCTTIQTDDAVKSDLRGIKIHQDVPEPFRMNAGRDMIVYSKAHPYFNVAPKDKQALANNFNLPLP